MGGMRSVGPMPMRVGVARHPRGPIAAGQSCQRMARGVAPVVTRCTRSRAMSWPVMRTVGAAAAAVALQASVMRQHAGYRTATARSALTAGPSCGAPHNRTQAYRKLACLPVPPPARCGGGTSRRPCGAVPLGTGVPMTDRGGGGVELGASAGGEPYVVDEEIAARGRRAARLSDEYHRAWVGGDDDLAGRLLVRLLGRVGAGVVVRPPLFVDFGEHQRRVWHVGNCNLTALDVARSPSAPTARWPGCSCSPDPPGGAGAATGEGESAEPITLGDKCGWAAG